MITTYSTGYTKDTAVINKENLTFPRYFGIANTNTQLVLSSISFRFDIIDNNGYVYNYLGDPLIQYSDDGTNWIGCPTYFVLGDNVQISYTPASTKTASSPSGPITIYSPPEYRSGKCITIYQDEHSTVHNYWRVVFNSGYFTTDQKFMAVHITNVNWIIPTEVSLFQANTNFGVSDIDSLQYAQTYGTSNQENILYITSGTNKQPMYIKYANGVLTVADFTPTSTPGLWTANGGFPACVEVFQNRLCFAGFNSFRGRVVMSEFGNFNNFTVPSPILATSPIQADSLQLKSRIDYLWAGDKALYALSSEGVAMIDAGGGVVATDQIEFKLRNREPAAGILPTVKDDVMIYAGRNLQKILITDFDFVVDRYRAVLTSLKYDNFLAAGIKGFHYIPTKASLIYGILNDGKGFAWLYNNTTQNNALFPLFIKDSVSDILPLKYQDVTKLLMVSNYKSSWTIISKDPQPETSLMDFMSEESMKIYTQNFITNNNFLDYYCSYNATSGFNWFPMPIAYTEEDIIEVFADGRYLGSKELEVKQLMLLMNANYTTEYYVENIADGEPVWVKNSETGIWNCYGSLSIVEGTISVNSIEIEDQGTTLDVVACNLDETAYLVSFGLAYQSYAVIKFSTPYLIRKFPREIAVNFINTAYLEVGNTFEDLRPVLGNLAETVTLDNKPILLNGNYEKTLDKQAFETPYVIVNSGKGLPFIITGLDYEIDYSNYQGGV